MKERAFDWEAVRRMDDPLDLVLFSIKFGYTLLSQKRKLVLLWNKYHSERPLSLPRKES